MSSYDALLSAAAQLPLDDRLRLISDLSETVPNDREIPLSPEWLAEIERRSAKYESGEAKLEDWESVRQRLFHRVNASREA